MTVRKVAISHSSDFRSLASTPRVEYINRGFVIIVVVALLSNCSFLSV